MKLLLSMSPLREISSVTGGTCQCTCYSGDRNAPISFDAIRSGGNPIGNTFTRHSIGMKDDKKRCELDCIEAGHKYDDCT